MPHTFRKKILILDHNSDSGRTSLTQPLAIRIGQEISSCNKWLLRHHFSSFLKPQRSAVLLANGVP